MRPLVGRSIVIVLLIACIPTAPASAVNSRPDAPIITKISTRASNKVSGAVTVWAEVASYDLPQILKTEIRVGTKTCVMKRNATRCTVNNVRLGSTVSVRARSQGRTGFSGWSDVVRYRPKSGLTWSEDGLPTTVNGSVPSATISTTTTVPRTTSTSSSSTTSTTTSTTTTLPYCLANPVPTEQTVFGRAWLDLTHWNIPGVDQASRYGAYPSAILQPSRCQTFSFTGIQTRPTGSTGAWSFVAYTVVPGSSGSAYARVQDIWGVNMNFRFVYEVYNMSTQQWEIRYVWKSPYSCGYTCTP